MATTRRVLWTLTVALGLTIVVGCPASPEPGDSPKENQTTASDNAATGTEDGEAKSTGNGSAIFTGQIVYTGDVPPPRKITVTKDQEFCGVAAGEIKEMELGKDDGLSSAIVVVSGVEAPTDGWKWKTPNDGFALHQKDCMFHPFLTVMPNGAELKIFNDDKVGHNVNAAGFNEMQGPDAAPITKMIKSRSPVRVQCNIHSWMEGWIYTVNSPHYAMTDGDGNFKIENIPPGEYKIKIWHPANVRAPRLKIKFEAGDTVTKKIVIEH